MYYNSGISTLLVKKRLAIVANIACTGFQVSDVVACDLSYSSHLDLQRSCRCEKQAQKTYIPVPCIVMSYCYNIKIDANHNTIRNMELVYVASHGSGKQNCVVMKSIEL